MNASPEPAPLPFPESLCHGCQALRRVDGARSVFLMCTALPLRYPPQPVLRCQTFRALMPQR
jgi:hypothetical protein